MGAKQEAVVREFLATLDATAPGDTAKLESLMADDIEYSPIYPAMVIKGLDGFRAEQVGHQTFARGNRSEITALASNDRNVFVEGTSSFDLNGTQITLHNLIVFEVNDDDKVSLWRFYWDSADLMQKMNLPPEQFEELKK